MSRRPRARIIDESPILVPSNPTSARTATASPAPTTGAVPATRGTANPRLAKSKTLSKEPACINPPRILVPARVKPPATRPPSPEPVASTSSSAPTSARPNVANSKPPTMDWSIVDRSRNNKMKANSVTTRKSTSSSSSRNTNISSRFAHSIPAKGGQIVVITGLPAKFNTAKALATEAGQLGISVQDIRIGRTSATLRSADPKVLSKLSALSDVVNARVTLKLVSTPSQSADL